MLKWLCYEESSVFYVEADTREEAQAFAALYNGRVVCPVGEMKKDAVGN
ncbi:MAG TPA: hypothetical protein VFW53_05865 [Gallionella sp.]|nr:hypothetical protein [Gallionella sp.]